MRAPDSTATATTLRDRLADGLAWAALCGLAIAVALTFRDYGLGWDDYTHSQYGDLLLSFYGSGFRDTRALSFVNLYLYGGGFDMAAQGLAKILPFDPFETRRLVGAVVGIAGVAVTWRLGRRLGGPLAGVLALLLLATCPLYYGHMFINAKDAPFAAAMALFLLGLVRLVDEHPKPSLATRAMVGLGFGLSIGSRVMAGFGVVEAIGAFAALFAIESRTFGARLAAARLRHVVVLLIPSAILAAAVMALLWPWSAVDPRNPFRAVAVFSHFFEKPWRELFDGALILTTDMPRRYLPLLFVVKLPVLFLGLSGIGAVVALIAAASSKAAPQRRAALFVVALAALLPIAVTVIARPAMYNGVRHFVFLLPPLAVLGGLAGASIAQRLARVGRLAEITAAAIFCVGVALPAYGMARLHPYEYVYFNALAGGAREAQHRFMLDYWGLAFKQAGPALRAELARRGEAPPAGGRWRIGVCGPHPPAHVALGDRFELTWDAKGADFAMQLGVFYCAKLDAPLLAEVVRDGVVFARVYDLRGRSVRSLFAYPAIVGE